MPALAKAKNRAQMAVDLNNCKQIMLATQLYIGDNRDYLPHPGWANGGTIAADCWAAGAGIVLNANGPGTEAIYPIYLKQQLIYAGKGQLMPYLKNCNILMCPADGPGKDPNFYKRAIVFTSYVWNGAVSGYSSGDSCKITSPTLKVDSVLQWEADETPKTSGSSYFNDFSSTPSEGISSRHGKGATVALFGGSAERINYDMWYRPNPANDLGYYNSFACCVAPANSPGYVAPNNTAPNRAWCNPATTDGH